MSLQYVSLPQGGYYKKMPILKAKKLDPSAKLPVAAHAGDLGYDLFVLEDTFIPAAEQVKVRTGIALEFPQGWGGVIKDRSSMASRRIYTSAGVIDPGYRGEILILMRNDNNEGFTLMAGDKIAQIIPLKAQNLQVIEVSELSETPRSEGGFGSTGKN